jgi:hypothetical protein
LLIEPGGVHPFLFSSVLLAQAKRIAWWFPLSLVSNLPAMHAITLNIRPARLLGGLCLLLLLGGGSLFAQNYQTGAGVRLGYASGVTVKHFLTPTTAIDGIIATRWEGFRVTGLYQVHATAFDVPELQWYYGGGLHAGYYGRHPNRDRRNGAVFGIDGVIGLEYTIGDIPFSFAVEWKPELNLVGPSNFWGEGGGLSIRYVW